MAGEKTVKTARTFVKADGSTGPRASEDIVGIRVQIEHGGNPIEIDLNKLAKEQPGMFRAAAGFGILTTVCNAFGGEKDPFEAREKALARLESIENGQWSAERQVGPRVTLLVEALARVQAARIGKDPGEEWRRSLAAKLKSEEVDAKALQANPKVRAELEQLKAERAAEEAKKAAETAQSSEDNFDFLDEVA